LETEIQKNSIEEDNRRRGILKPYLLQFIYMNTIIYSLCSLFFLWVVHAFLLACLLACLKFALAISLGYASIGPCASIAGNGIGISTSLEIIAFLNQFTFVALDETHYATIGTHCISSKSCVALATENCFHFFIVFFLFAPHWVIFVVIASVINTASSAANP